MISKILQFLARFFKSGKPPESTKIEAERSSHTPKIKPAAKKIAIIIGHGHGDSGASGWNGVDEYDYNCKVAVYLEKNVSNHEIKLFHRTASGIVGVASRVVLWQPDISIELHCNAYNGAAKGCEVLVLKGDENSADLGVSFAESFCKKFDRISRGHNGIRWVSTSDRGGTSLKAVSPIKQSILVEPIFLDNEKEWIDPLTYAEFLSKWIEKQ